MFIAEQRSMCHGPVRHFQAQLEAHQEGALEPLTEGLRGCRGSRRVAMEKLCLKLCLITVRNGDLE